MSIENTGVRLSPELLLEANRRAAEVYNTPLVIVHGRSLRDDAREAFMAWIDERAQEHGLPKPGLIEGDVNHYGLAPNGEFTRYEPDGVDHAQVP